MRKRIDGEDKKAVIIFSVIALIFLLAVIGFFSWHTVRMRTYELNFVREEGTITGVEKRHGSSGDHGSTTYYYYKITYEFNGEEHTFVDSKGHRYVSTKIFGTPTEIYVNPQNPAQAAKVSSADDLSIICACFYAFFCATYAAAMNILLSARGSSLKKRFLCVWGAELLLSVIMIFLFWIGLPNSGLGAVFTRIEGAVGVTVVASLVLLVFILDCILSGVIKRYNKRHVKKL